MCVRVATARHACTVPLCNVTVLIIFTLPLCDHTVGSHKTQLLHAAAVAEINTVAARFADMRGALTSALSNLGHVTDHELTVSNTSFVAIQTGHGSAKVAPTPLGSTKIDTTLFTRVTDDSIVCGAGAGQVKELAVVIFKREKAAAEKAAAPSSASVSLPHLSSPGLPGIDDQKQKQDSISGTEQLVRARAAAVTSTTSSSPSALTAQQLQRVAAVSAAAASARARTLAATARSRHTTSSSSSSSSHAAAVVLDSDDDLDGCHKTPDYMAAAAVAAAASSSPDDAGSDSDRSSKKARTSTVRHSPRRPH